MTRTPKSPAETGKAACPICGAGVVASYRPFCSSRCADIDLGRWMTGRYALPGTTPADGAHSGEEDENGR